MTGPSSFYTVYHVAIWLSALFSLGLTWLCWQRRDAIGGRPTLVRLLATSWWLLCYLAPLPQALITSTTTDVFLRVNLIMLGLVFTPPAILAFVLEYTGRIRTWRWNTTVQDALARAAQWNALFAQTAFDFRGRSVHATFSAGVAVFPDDARYRTALLEAADIALYDAKARGRNQVRHAAQGAGAMAC